MEAFRKQASKLREKVAMQQQFLRNLVDVMVTIMLLLMRLNFIATKNFKCSLGLLEQQRLIKHPHPLIGGDSLLHFISDNDAILSMRNLSKVEFVHILRRQSTGFSSGSSKYRGVTLHKCCRWDARMGQLLGKNSSTDISKIRRQLS